MTMSKPASFISDKYFSVYQNGRSGRSVQRWEWQSSQEHVPYDVHSSFCSCTQCTCWFWNISWDCLWHFHVHHCVFWKNVHQRFASQRTMTTCFAKISISPLESIPSVLQKRHWTNKLSECMYVHYIIEVAHYNINF